MRPHSEARLPWDFSGRPVALRPRVSPALPFRGSMSVSAWSGLPLAVVASPQIELDRRRADVIADVDVCVVGGGPAGLGAALAAARLGASVCLLERHAFLGGNFTAASVGSVCGLYVGDGSGGFDYVTGGIAAEVAEALKDAGRAVGPIPFQGS